MNDYDTIDKVEKKLKQLEDDEYWQKIKEYATRVTRNCPT